MNKIRIASAMLAVMTIFLIAGAAPVANFSGTWKLDKGRSQNLPPSFQKASSASLIIEHSGSSMNITHKLVINDEERVAWQRSYTLDGQPRASSPGPNVQGTATIAGRYIKAGNALELTAVRQIEADGQPVTVTTVDILEIVNGALKIIATTSATSGTERRVLIFTRQ